MNKKYLSGLCRIKWVGSKDKGQTVIVQRHGCKSVSEDVTFCRHGPQLTFGGGMVKVYELSSSEYTSRVVVLLPTKQFVVDFSLENHFKL